MLYDQFISMISIRLTIENKNIDRIVISDNVHSLSQLGASFKQPKFHFVMLNLTLITNQVVLLA